MITLWKAANMLDSCVELTENFYTKNFGMLDSNKDEKLSEEELTYFISKTNYTYDFKP
jgi:hypothetical protein